MQSYRLDSVSQLIGFHGSEIGLIVILLKRGDWKRTTINGQLKSKFWWESRLEKLINSPTVVIPQEFLWDGRPAEPMDIPTDA